MAPPSFSDLGKDANDLFDKDFKTGLCNFDLKSKTCTNSDVKITGTHDIIKQGFTALFETKNKLTSGVTSKLKVDSKWALTHELEVSDRIIRNMKQTLITTLQGSDNEKIIMLKNNHKACYHNIDVDLNFKESCPKSVWSLVVSPQSCRIPVNLGVSAVLEPRSHFPSKANLALFYKYKDLQILGGVDMAQNVDFNVYHPSSLVDMGFKLRWENESRSMTAAVAFLYRPSLITFIKGKVDSALNVGLSYGVKVAEGVNLTFSTQLDAKNLHGGEHKLGMNIEACA